MSRIWMIGNGPSLTTEVLERLRGEQTFAMNAISFIYPHTQWRPSFYLCASSNVVRLDRQVLFWRSVALGVPTYLLSEWRNSVFFDAPHVRWINLDAKRGEFRWSHDIDRFVGRCHTSMYIAMQIAVALGFRELYLVGCDMGWGPLLRDDADPNHFDRGYSIGASMISEADAAKIEAGMTLAHELAKKETERAGVRVYNATNGGRLEVYPRVSLEEVIG